MHVSMLVLEGARRICRVGVETDVERCTVPWVGEGGSFLDRSLNKR